MKKETPLHELRLGLDVIALSDSCEQLLFLKAKIIFENSIRFCEGLTIHFCGRERWIFDKDFNKKTASRYLSDSLLGVYYA